MRLSLYHILKAGLLFFIILFFLPETSYAQRRIFLNLGNNGQFDPNPTNIASVNVKVGEIVSVDVWYDVGTLSDMIGIAAYFTFDDGVMQIIDQNPSDQGSIAPFISGFSSFTITSVNMNEINSIPGGQFVGSYQVNPPNTRTGLGRLGRFQYRAVSRTPGSDITIDYDLVNHRDTKMFFTDLTIDRFDFRLGLRVTVVGAAIEELPDLLMAPGQTITDYFDLDDYLVNAGDSPAIEYAAEPVDSVTVSINPSTHEVSFTAEQDFAGFRDVVFSVTDEFNDVDYDTMQVVVSYKPEFSDFLKNEIRFKEDSTFTASIDTLAVDLDNPSTSLRWDAYSLHDSIEVSLDDSTSARALTLKGKPDWFGIGEVVFRVEDTHGSFDTTATSVNIQPVNDIPIFVERLPDFHLLPGEIDSSLVVSQYVRDIDTPISSLKYIVQGNTNVFFALNPSIPSGFIISHKPGYVGSEQVFITVYDTTPVSSDRDTIRVTVGPKPPVLSGLPDTTVFSTNVPLLNVPYVDLKQYVVDEDDPISSLTWGVLPSGLDLTVRITDGIVSFNVPANLHKIEKVIFTVTDQQNGVGMDTVMVKVINDGRPLIFGIEPEYYVPAGGSLTAFSLDTVAVDDGPIDSLVWTATGQQNIEVDINTSTRIVTFLSPIQNFVGTESITFSARDKDGKIGIYTTQVRAILFGKPILSNIPDVQITKNISRSLDLNKNLIIFPDSLRQVIEWKVSPTTDPRVFVQLGTLTGLASFSVIDPAFKGNRSFTFTAVNTLNGEQDTDDMDVIVTFGREPIVGHLPDVTFQTGDTLVALDLDKYVFDPDTPDDSIKWVFSSIKQEINTDQTTLERGASHQLTLWARRGFVGRDNVIMTAMDPEGNAVSDTFETVVSSSGSLELMVIPSPVSLDYIDIIVFSSDTLLGTPSIFMTINKVKEEIKIISRIANNLIWKSDYVFDIGTVGNVIVMAEAADNVGSVIRDSTFFEVGEPELVGAYTFSDDILSMVIPPGSLEDSDRVIIMPEETRHTYRYYSNDKYPDGLDFPVLSYFIGPVGLPVKNSISLSFNLDGLNISEQLRRHYGLYRLGGDDHAGAVEFLSILKDRHQQTVNTEIDKLGRYFIAADFTPPEIVSVESFDPLRLNFSLNIAENESGVLSAFTSINNHEYANSLEIRDGVYDVIIVDEYNTAGHFVLDASVTDRAGNRSESFTFPFFLESAPLPKTYALKQNYPNPFNPTTMIEYQLPENDHVVLKIYNINGQEVRALVNEYQPGGYHSVKWDGLNMRGTSVSAGIYLYHLKTGKFAQSRKMILIK
ncbi:FlgD immunoglobulin-like domain containing protein [candidate division KSB1 bacterium]